LKVSVYPHIKDKSQQPVKVLDLNWDEVVEYIGAKGWMRDPDVATRSAYTDKFDVPLWSGHVLKANSRRLDQNVEAIHVMAIDFDENASIEDVDWAFGDWQRIVHTTWQHTPANPRCRVILPLRRPVKPGEEFDKLAKFLKEHALASGLKPDNTFDEARFFFLPASPDESNYHYVYADSGDLCTLLDPDSVLGGRTVAGETKIGSERPGGSVTVDTQDGPVDVIEWAMRTAYDPDDQKNTKVKCTCPFAEGASFGSAFVRRVRTGAVVVCTSSNHGHPGSPWKWYYRLGEGQRGDHPIFDAKADQTVLPKLQMKISEDGKQTNKIMNTAGNIGRIVTSDHRFKDKPWFNEFTHQMMFGNDLLEDKVGDLAIIVESAYDIRIAVERMKQFMTAEARRRSRNPLAEWIEALPEWDRVGRIDTWLIDVFGVRDIPLTRAMGAKWLISAIGRALRPGCKVDTMLVVSGPQGIGKSTVFRNLCPTSDEIGISVFSDASIDVESPDACRIVSAAWIVEFAEFKDIRAKEVEAVKQFLTRQYDEWVPKYKEETHRFPRHAVFCGTTNERDVLVDQTGNRRFFMVEAEYAMADFVRELRDQLWAEALWRYRNHVGSRDPWVLTPEEDIQLELNNKEFEATDSAADILTEWLFKKREGDIITIADVWQFGLRKQGTPNRTEARNVGRVMRKLLGEPGQIWRGDKNYKAWTMPREWGLRQGEGKVIPMREA
jgi:predicted P-loop ATPase